MVSLLVVGSLAVMLTAPTPATATGDPTVGKTLTFDDEFTGGLDTNVWNNCPRNDAKTDASRPAAVQSRDCWAGNFSSNGSSFAACFSPSEVTVSAGAAVLTAERSNANCPGEGWPTDYQAGYLDTEPIKAVGHPGFVFRYGYAEVRMKVPAGNGLFPAFWLKPAFPGSSPRDPFEIDTFEFHGDQPATAEMGYRMGEWGSEKVCKQFAHPSPGASLTDAFHTYGVDWEPDAVTFFLDGVAVNTCTPDQIHIPDVSSFLIIQWQLEDGELGHAPIGPNTPLPAQVQLDWVHVYQPISDVNVVRVDDSAVVEGTSGQNTTAHLRLRLDRPAAQPVSVRVTSANGIAFAPADYNSFFQTVTFAAGARVVDLPFEVVADSADENDEPMLALLDQPSAGLVVGTPLVTISIVDDDGPQAQAPPAPIKMAFTERGADVTPWWTLDPLATGGGPTSGFEVERARWVAGVWSEWTFLGTTSLAQQSYTDLDLADGLYAYLVRARNGAGWSPWLIAVTERSSATTPPSAPTGLNVVRSGSDAALSWTDAANNELVYDVERARYVAGVWSEWTSWAADRNATGFVDHGVPDGEYAYLVRARNSVGASAWNIVVHVHSTATAPPGAPTGLAAQAVGSRVGLAWTDASTNELGFDIMRAHFVAGVWTEWTSWVADVNAASFSDSPVPAGKYAYLVRSRNALGPSAWAIVVTDVV